MLNPIVVPKLWAPHKYQIAGVKWLLEHACAALFADPGLGKTSVTLAAFKILKKKGVASKALLVAPLRPCYSVWPREIMKWLDFNGLTYEILHGPDKENALKREADIYLINPAGLDWLMEMDKTVSEKTGKTSIAVDRRRFKAFGFDTLIIDELSMCKNTTSNRFKGLKSIVDLFQRRWGLTGSPAANGLMNLFGEMYILDLGRSLGRFVTHFRKEFFDAPDYGFKWTLKEGGKERIYERISPLVMVIDESNLTGLPTVIENNIFVDLPEDSQRIYDALADKLITGIEEHTVTAANVGVAIGKCRQVTNGGIYYDAALDGMGLRIPKQKREWANLHTAKVDALQDLVEELQGAPLLVAYDFGHDLDRLRKAFPKATFVADYPATKFDRIERMWNNGEIEVMFGHPQSIGHGLNLQECGHHVAWHSLIYDFELYDQFNRRVYRQGNKHKRVFIHHILGRGTIDELILFGFLKKKGQNQRDMLEALKELARLSKRRK